MPVPPPPTEVAARLRTAVARADRLLAKETPGGGLTRTQLSVLGAVTRRGQLRLAELVDREGLNPTMLSRIVGALEREGLLQRLPDTGDRRAVVLEATPAGADLHARLLAERTGLIEDYLAGLAPEQARALVDALPVLEGLGEHLLARGARVPARAGA